MNTQNNWNREPVGVEIGSSVSSPASSPDHRDAHLFALWSKFRATDAEWRAFARDSEGRIGTPGYDPRADDTVAHDLWMRRGDVLDQILAAEARTLDGLLVKLRAAEAEAESGVSDGEDMGLPSLIRSIEAMGGQLVVTGTQDA
jgi:hypothetical protein